MLVSAISMCENGGGVIMNSAMPYYNLKNDPITDTSFNSLNTNINQKANRNEKLSQVFDSINEWQNFCHDRIVGKNLDIIA